MSGFIDAVETFFEHLAAVRWAPLGIAVLCHAAKVACIARAWRNVVAAAYPEARVHTRTTLGAYLAGSGVNAIIPARAGELLKLYLVRHRVEGSTYTTLAATLLVLAMFDALVAGALLVWAVQQDVLPGLDVLPSLPAFDVGFALDHPRATLTVAFLLVMGLIALGVWAYGHVAAFHRRVAQAFTIVRDRPRYLRSVAGWQAIDWGFRLATLYFFLRAFGLVDDLHNALLVQVTQSLSTLVPFSPGGIGTEQALLVYVFTGTAGTTAVLSFSVGMRIVLIVANVVMGFIAIGLMLRTLRWRRHLDAASQRA